MLKIIKSVLLLSIVFSSSILFAVDKKTEHKLLTYLSSIIKSKPTLIKKSPIKGLYMVMFEAKLLFVSEDGRYVFESSPLVDLKTRSNFSETIVTKVRKQMLENTDSKAMIVYNPKINPKHTITVFTDIDCPYCQRLHQERKELLKNGVQIRYLMYPRTGINSKSYKTAEAVWCSKNQQTAMTKAKQIASYNNRASRSGGKLKPQVTAENCNAPIRKHIELLNRLDMEASTPQILLDSGELIRGYLPAKDLLKIIYAQTT